MDLSGYRIPASEHNDTQAMKTIRQSIKVSRQDDADILISNIISPTLVQRCAAASLACAATVSRLEGAIPFSLTLAHADP